MNFSFADPVADVGGSLFVSRRAGDRAWRWDRSGNKLPRDMGAPRKQGQEKQRDRPYRRGRLPKKEGKPDFTSIDIFSLALWVHLMGIKSHRLVLLHPRGKQAFPLCSGRADADTPGSTASLCPRRRRCSRPASQSGHGKAFPESSHQTCFPLEKVTVLKLLLNKQLTTFH